MADSHEAFANVDEMVAKPVFGSDGALAWQEFKSTNKQVRKGGTAAPNIPMKRTDRLGTGLKSIEEERALENAIRKKSGKASIGEGYTEFKLRGNEQEEAKLKKKKKMIESRIRPDDVQYFIHSSTFIGWKKDYVFTTRDNYGTGYYWDGMDSARESLGLPVHWLPDPSEGENRSEVSASGNISKKKKRRIDVTASEIIDNNNPLEQVSNAIARVRNLNTVSSVAVEERGKNARPKGDDDLGSSVPGWVAVQDLSTGRTYFYHTETRETRWDKPMSKSQKSGEEGLPPGWNVARDKDGKEYYYHANGQTTWDRPSI